MVVNRAEYVRQLVMTLEQADIVCQQCGETYGSFVPRRLCTSWRGVCDVCGEPGVVCSPRHYSNFRQGLQTLQDELDAF
jgi:rRNA maturation protein Nop10